MTETTIDEFEENFEEELEDSFEEIEEDFDPEPDESNLDEPARASRWGLSKMNLILAGLVLLQALLAAFMLWPRGAQVESGAPLLAGLGGAIAADESADGTESADSIAASDALTNLSLTDDTGKTIVLERSGADWVLAGTDGFPVKADSVSDIADKLAAVTTERLVTRTASSHERLQVAEDDFVRKLALTTEDGTQTLYVGSSPASNATHVRLDGQDETFLAGDINSWELATTASNWIETSYYQATATDVTEITLENANGSFTFTRPAPAAAGSEEVPARDWSLFGLGLNEELNQSAITSLVSQATNLRMTTPLGKSAQPDYGLDAAQATINLTLETAEGEKSDATLLVGAQDDDSTDYVIKSSGSEYYVLVSSFNGEQFVNKSRTDFVTEIEPEASEEPSGEEQSEEQP